MWKSELQGFQSNIKSILQFFLKIRLHRSLWEPPDLAQKQNKKSENKITKKPLTEQIETSSSSKKLSFNIIGNSIAI